MSGSDPRREEAKRLSVDKGMTQEAIAQHFNVSVRTIERWASQDGWGARKKAQKVVSIGEAKSKTQPLPPNPVNTTLPTPTREPVRVRRRDRGEIDELEIVEGAIVNLDLLLSSMSSASGDDRPIDTRGIGTTAGALVKLLEYRRKIQPPTAADLAEQILALGITPNELVAELKARWQPQQRA